MYVETPGRSQCRHVDTVLAGGRTEEKLEVNVEHLRVAGPSKNQAKKVILLCCLVLES